MTDSGRDKPPIPTILGLVVVLAIPAVVFVGPRVYGTTPQELADEPLARSPAEVARDLRRTSATPLGVTAEFKEGSAGEYESVSLTWSPGVRDTLTDMRLRAERHADVADTVSSALRRRLRSFRNGKYVWGAVTIRVSDRGDAWFDVDPQPKGKANPLVDRQVEACKELLLNAAFGLPIRVSDREIADALGTGYSPAALARFDAGTRIESAATALRAAFPATVARDSSSFEVPLDHPLVRAVTLSWANQPGGRLEDVTLEPTADYAAGRASLESCLAKKLGPPKIDVTDYGANKKDYAFAIGKTTLELRASRLSLSDGVPFDAGSFAEILQALDACRDAPEIGGDTK